MPSSYSRLPLLFQFETEPIKEIYKHYNVNHVLTPSCWNTRDYFITTTRIMEQLCFTTFQVDVYPLKVRVKSMQAKEKTGEKYSKVEIDVGAKMKQQFRQTQL